MQHLIIIPIVLTTIFLYGLTRFVVCAIKRK